MLLSDLLIVAGALAGGFVSGLTGFGTGITALAFWLYAVPPVLAAPLVVVCSIIAQIQTLPAIWHAVAWRRVLPFVAGGLLGVPLGAALLPLVPLALFKAAIGALLLVYCSVMLFVPVAAETRRGGGFVDGLIGFGGGTLGGLAGLSGPLPTIWCRFRGWNKDEQRGVFQIFNLAILSFAALNLSVGGLMTLELGRLVLLALPGTLLGAWLGRRCYARLATESFNRAVLVVLMLSGLTLIATAL